MNWPEHILGSDWKVKSAGGLTGDAFVAEKNHKRLFIKRNSSPFLAVLSAEGIVPKLIWTKRVENGDVITAQRWLEGRKLKPEEMKSQKVANILHKIHHSPELLHMLLRLGKKPITSNTAYDSLVTYAAETISAYRDIEIASSYLKDLLPYTTEQEMAVCHCDVNHNNFILTHDNQLFLVDWDNAMITDPATDFSTVLKWYVPESEWDAWLEKYGIEREDYFLERTYWYLLLNTVHYFNWHLERNEHNNAMEQLQKIRKLNDEICHLF